MAAVNGELTPFTTGRHGVSHDRRVPRPDGLPARQRVDRGDREVLRRASPSRASRVSAGSIGPRSPRSAGQWDRAEQELERATVELEAYRATRPQADGFYAIGDIRRLRGDFEGAEAALREAHARGRTPQPALALIRLAEGKTKAGG